MPVAILGCDLLHKHLDHEQKVIKPTATCDKLHTRKLKEGICSGGHLAITFFRSHAPPSKRELPFPCGLDHACI